MQYRVSNPLSPYAYRRRRSCLYLLAPAFGLRALEDLGLAKRVCYRIRLKTYILERDHRHPRQVRVSSMTPRYSDPLLTMTQQNEQAINQISYDNLLV